MDYEELFRLLPKEPKKWTQQEVLVWLKHIGYSQLDSVFVKEGVDGACLGILVEQDLIDMGLNSGLQRKKILQWIQIGLKEYSNFIQLNSKQMADSHLEYNSEAVDENISLGQINVKAQVQPGQRPKVNFNQVPQPNRVSQTISEETLAKQVQYTKKGIFSESQPVQIKKLIDTPPKNQSHSLEESDYHLPHFGSGNQQQQQQQQQQSQQQQYQYQQQPFSQAQTKIGQKEPILQVKVRDLSGQSALQYSINANATIGRSPDNTIVLNHESISRNHAQLVLKDSKFFLSDNESLIGTYILIEQKTQIQQGFIIQIDQQDYTIKFININKSGLQFNLINENQTYTQNINVNSALPFKSALFEYFDDQLSIEDQKSSQGIWLKLSKQQQLPITKRRVMKIAEFVLMIEPL